MVLDRKFEPTLANRERAARLRWMSSSLAVSRGLPLSRSAVCRYYPAPLVFSHHNGAVAGDAIFRGPCVSGFGDVGLFGTRAILGHLRQAIARFLSGRRRCLQGSHAAKSGRSFGRAGKRCAGLGPDERSRFAGSALPAAAGGAKTRSANQRGPLRPRPGTTPATMARPLASANWSTVARAGGVQPASFAAPADAGKSADPIATSPARRPAKASPAPPAARYLLGAIPPRRTAAAGTRRHLLFARNVRRRLPLLLRGRAGRQHDSGHNRVFQATDADPLQAMKKCWTRSSPGELRPGAAVVARKRSLLTSTGAKPREWRPRQLRHSKTVVAPPSLGPGAEPQSSCRIHRLRLALA